MAMLGGNTLFIDTNVLIYATDTLSPLQQQARDTLHTAQRAGTELVVSSQLQTMPTTGKHVHDANIVATMQAYGIRQLLTHNVTDFTRFAGLVTIVPLLPRP